MSTHKYVQIWVNGTKVRSTGNVTWYRNSILRDFGILDYPESGRDLTETIFSNVPYKYWMELTENGKEHTVYLNIELRIIKKHNIYRRVMNILRPPIKFRLRYQRLEDLATHKFKNNLYLEEVI